MVHTYLSQVYFYKSGYVRGKLLTHIICSFCACAAFIIETPEIEMTSGGFISLTVISGYPFSFFLFVVFNCMISEEGGEYTLIVGFRDAM